MRLREALGGQQDDAATGDQQAPEEQGAPQGDQAPPQGDQAPPHGDQAPAAWQWAEGVPGTGEKPEWFKEGKYKSVAEQARAYQGLESKLGKGAEILGAPEETADTKATAGYNINEFVPEGLEGVEIDPEDPMLQSLLPEFRDLGLSQAAVTKVAQAWVKTMAESQSAAEATVQTAVREMGGPEAVQQRFNGIRQYATANLTKDMAQGLERMIDSGFHPEGFAAIEQLISRHRGAAPAGPGVTSAPSISLDEVKKMQLATDENGRRKMQTDPTYAKRVRGLLREVEGTEPSIEIMGRS